MERRQGDVRFSSTAAGLMSFLDFAMSHGRVRPQDGANYKSACSEVLPAALGPAWQSVDVESFDVADLVERYQTARGVRLKPAGVERYKEHLSRATALFTPYIDDGTAAETDPTPEPDVDNGRAFSKDSAPMPETLTYPFPLRPGVVATLEIPPDLTRAEADRLSKFLDSLVVETSRPVTPTNGQRTRSKAR